MAYQQQPQGFYQGSIRSWDFSQNKNNNFQLSLEYQLTHFHPDDPNAEEFQPLERAVRRTVFQILTAKTKERVLADLKAIGYDKPLQAKHLSPLGDEPFDFSKAEPHVVECFHDSYEDKATGKQKPVERWTIVRRKKITEVTREQAAQFDAIMGEAGNDSPN